jgi:hypothetical protein
MIYIYVFKYDDLFKIYLILIMSVYNKIVTKLWWWHWIGLVCVLSTVISIIC